MFGISFIKRVPGRLIVVFINKGQRIVRDWSLITWRGGGLQNRRGGRHVKFYTNERGGGGIQAILKRGHTKFWDSFCMEACGSFSHIEGGVQKVYTL